ncbi:MAG: hypothetical protein LBV30_01645 [Propionibacteriaceae bacterium]|nr:hypothetical protein [Propionibacteriaceae bacterium]
MGWGLCLGAAAGSVDQGSGRQVPGLAGGELLGTRDRHASDQLVGGCARSARGRGLVLLLGLVLSLSLAGCVEEFSHDPLPPAPPEATLTLSPAEAKTWSPDQLGAIDIVQQYITLWDKLATNLYASDLDELGTVLINPMINDELMALNAVRGEGYTYSGWTEFTVDDVQPIYEGGSDMGPSWRVSGCYIVTNSTTRNKEGTVLTQGRVERSQMSFDAVFLEQDQVWRLYDSESGDSIC